jgi:hypothetical protein
MTMQKTTGGNLLRLTGGTLAKECCCTGGTGSSCAGGDPEMLCTIFDADYAGGNINWAGQTWTPSEVQAGTQKTVCPSSYSKNIFKTTVITGGSSIAPTYQWAGDHYWINTGLTLRRRAGTVRNAGGRHYRYDAQFSFGVAANEHTLRVKGSTDNVGFFGGFTTSAFARPVAISYTQVPPTYATFQIGLISGVAAGVGTTGSYSITNAWFGSHTISGVQYTWAKGAGW